MVVTINLYCDSTSKKIKLLRAYENFKKLVEDCYPQLEGKKWSIVYRDKTDNDDEITVED